MAKLARAVVSPLSIIDKGLGKLSLQVVAVAAALTGHLEIAALAAVALQVLYKPKLPKPPTAEGAVKTSIPPRVSAYGRSRLYWSYALFETAEDGTAVDVGAVHDGGVDGVEAYYIGDELVTLTGNVVDEGPDGRYRDGAVSIYHTSGAATETAFAAVIAALPSIWTSNHRGDGVVMLAVLWKAVKAKRFNETYPQGQPVPVSIAARWQKVFDWRDEAQSVDDPDAWTWSENACLHLAHYELVREKARRDPSAILPSPEALQDAWDLFFAPTIAFWTAAADDCDAAMATKYGAGTTTVLAAMGATSITLDSVFGLTPGETITFESEETKVVVSIVGNVVNFTGGLSFEYEIGNYVQWSGGTEPRYRSCVSHRHTDDHKDVRSNLTAAFDGWISPRSDGALVVYSGRYYAPTVRIGPEHIVSFSWQDGIADEDALNEIPVSYVSAAHGYNTVEADAWEDDDDIGTRGRVRSEPLENQVPSHAQARRLAKRFMARQMAPFRGTVTTNIAGRIVRGERYIDLHIEEAGAVFYSGPAEITAVTRNVSSGGVTFAWIAADPNIDNWDANTEEGEPAGTGDRVAPQPLAAPVIDTAVATFDAEGVRITLDVDAPDRDDLTWYVRWRLDGATLWGPVQTFPDIDGGPAVTLITDLVPANADVEIEVAYEVGDGRVSEWSDLEEVDTSTSALAPAPPTEVTATGSSGTADVTWRNPTSANLSYIKIFRHTSAVFGSATAITGELVGGLGEVMSITDSGLSAGTYYYWAVAYNADDIASAPAGPDSATVS